MPTAKIIEIFHSLQGEGIFLGDPTTFVRFLGCNLACGYCDTRYAAEESRASELSSEQVVERVRFQARRGEFVALTGGEPLLWADFIAATGPALKTAGYRLYLETNGSMPQELAKIVALIDVVAMDIKPPSACGADLWETHREFLRIASAKAFVKLVVANNTPPDEAERAATLVAERGRAIPLVLQPAEGPLAPDLRFVRRCQAAADRHLDQVHIISQMHKRWGVR